MTDKKLSAIIYSDRHDVRTAVRDELKKMGFSSERLINPADSKDCKTQIDSLPAALLILDWHIGADVVLDILDHNNVKGKIESHVSFLIAPQLDPNIVSAASEYYVSQIHTGQISVDQIKICLLELQREANNLTPIKRLLTQISDFKKRGLFADIDKLLEPVYPKLATNPRIAIEYGQNLMDMGNHAKAEEVLKKAAALDPPSARAKNLLARLYLKMGKKDFAVRSYQGAQGISPYNIKRLAELGNLFLEMGRPKDAERSFDQILNLAPESKEGNVGKSTALLAQGNINEALVLLKETVNMSELASVFNTAAIVAIQQGHHNDAISLYKSAIAAVGKNKKVEARLWYNMGIGFVKWKKLDDSLGCFNKAIALDPSFSNATHNIQVLEKATQKTKAKAAPKAASKSGPSLEETGVTEEILGSENLNNALGNLNFDLDFDDNLLD